MSISKKKFARAFGARIKNTSIFQIMPFQIYALSRKNLYFGEVFICKSYFIYTLFKGKSYEKNFTLFGK